MADQVQEFEYTLAGRTMRFKTPRSGQIIMLQRMRHRAIRLLEQETDPATRMATISTLNLQALDLIESLFVDPTEIEFVEQAMIEGKLDLPDLMPILSGGEDVQAPDDDADPVAPPASLKGKKSAAVAKKTAGRPRGTR